MIITDYYKFENIQATKSTYRIDCTASTKSYNPLEALRNKQGVLFIYAQQNFTKADKKRRADIALSKNVFISSLYQPNLRNDVGFGDMKGTEDVFLFVVDGRFIDGHYSKGSMIEIFVCRGMRAHRNNLFTMLTDKDPDLWDEIEELRSKATPENAPDRKEGA